jgi:GST-like protein
MIFYDFEDSPNCLKIKIILNELGIPYERRAVDRPVLRGQNYREKFPTGFAPAIEDGDLRISESSAIALYLAEKHGKLMPTDPQRRALVFQALSIESAILAPTVGGMGLFGELYKPEAERNTARIGELRERAQRVCQILGAVLGPRQYFAEDFSIADAHLYAATAKSLEGGVFQDPPSNLVAWHRRMTERPSVAKARKDYTHYR